MDKLIMWRANGVQWLKWADNAGRHGQITKVSAGFRLHIYSVDANGRLVAGSVNDSIHATMSALKKYAQTLV